MSASLNGVIPAQTGRAKTFAPSFPRYIAKGDGIRYINDFSHTFVADFDYELIWQRMDTASGTGNTDLSGDSASTSSRLLVSDSGNANPSRLTYTVGGVNVIKNNALSGVAQGQYVKIGIKINGAVGSIFIDGAYIGDFAGDVSGDWTIGNIGSVNNGTNTFNSVIADVEWTDYAELPKGTYLKGDGTAYVQVAIPVVIGDVIEFDYVPLGSGANQRLLGFSNTNSVTQTFVDVLSYQAFASSFTVDGVEFSSGVYIFIDGVKVRLRIVMSLDRTISSLLADYLAGGIVVGTITNFTVNGTEYIYPLKAPYITDNGDGTAIALQTGSVAEFGGELWGTEPESLGIGWTVLGENDYQSTALSGVAIVKPAGFSVENNSVVSVTYEVYDYISGRVRPLVYGVGVAAIGTNVTANGVYTENMAIDTATSSFSNSTLFQAGSGGFNGKIRNITSKQTSNGLIPVFDPATNLVDYASNVVSYPIDEATGLDVLAYDENGARWEGVDLLTNASPTIFAPWVDNLDGTYSIDGTQTTTLALFWQFLFPADIAAGDSYFGSFEIISISAGSFSQIVVEAQGAASNSVGIYTERLTTVTAADRRYRLVASPDFIGKVRPISVGSSVDALWTPDADHVFQGGFVGVGAVVVTDGTAAPDHFANGLPYEADGSLAVDSVSTITGVSAAIPVTAAGRIAIGTTPARANMGAMPLTADGRLVMAAGAVSHYSSGVPYTAVPQIAANFK